MSTILTSDSVPSVFPYKPATSPWKSGSALLRYHRAEKRQIQSPESTATKRQKTTAEAPEFVKSPDASGCISASQQPCKIHHLQQQTNAAFVHLHHLQSLSYAEVMSAASVADDDNKCQNMTGLKWSAFICLFSFIGSDWC